MHKKDIIILSTIITIIILSLLTFVLYVKHSRNLPKENTQMGIQDSTQEQSIPEKVKGLVGDIGVELEPTQGNNRIYIGDEESGAVVNLPRNPLVGDKSNEDSYNAIADVLFMFEEDVNSSDGTKYFGLDNSYYSSKEDAAEFIDNFFNEDITYCSDIKAYTKITEGIYYVSAEFYQFRLEEGPDISDFSKLMKFTIDINSKLIYPSKFVKSYNINGSIDLSDCKIDIKSADCYLNEIFVNTEVNNTSNESYNFKDRYNLITKIGDMELEKGFDIFTIDYQVYANTTVKMKFKYVYTYTDDDIVFQIENLTTKE